MAVPSEAQISPVATKAAIYRTIWRWHFYAGLFVVPMVLILSLTGAAYLFKPQIERWEERAWQGQPFSIVINVPPLATVFFECKA